MQKCEDCLRFKYCISKSYNNRKGCADPDRAHVVLPYDIAIETFNKALGISWFLGVNSREYIHDVIENLAYRLEVFEEQVPDSAEGDKDE